MQRSLQATPKLNHPTFIVYSPYRFNISDSRPTLSSLSNTVYILILCLVKYHPHVNQTSVSEIYAWHLSPPPYPKFGPERKIGEFRNFSLMCHSSSIRSKRSCTDFFQHDELNLPSDGVFHAAILCGRPNLSISAVTHTVVFLIRGVVFRAVLRLVTQDMTSTVFAHQRIMS